MTSESQAYIAYICKDVLRYIISFLGAREILVLYRTSSVFHVVDDQIVIIRKNVEKARDYIISWRSNSGIRYFLHEGGRFSGEFADAIMRIRSPKIDLSPVFIYEILEKHYNYAERVVAVCGFDRLAYSMLFFTAYPNADAFKILMRDAERRKNMPAFLALQESSVGTLSEKHDLWRDISMSERIAEIKDMVMK